jgi:hypothetical protein
MHFEEGYFIQFTLRSSISCSSASKIESISSFFTIPAFCLALINSTSSSLQSNTECKRSVLNFFGVKICGMVRQRVLDQYSKYTGSIGMEVTNTSCLFPSNIAFPSPKRNKLRKKEERQEKGVKKRGGKRERKKNKSSYLLGLTEF